MKLLRSHPDGLSTLFFVEMWERFSYYGMRALLTLFMVAPASAGGLGFAMADAAAFYGNYTMAVYLLSIPGGYVADSILGPRAAVRSGGLLIAAGHFTLAIPAQWSFFLGLVLIALGTGLFKPSISTLVGHLYGRDDPRRDAGFSIFYMGINIGALIAPLVTGFLAQSAVFKGWLAAAGLDPAQSWHWGFAAAGVGMTIAVVLFARRQALLGSAAESHEIISGAGLLPLLGVLVGSAVLLAALILSDTPQLSWLRYVILAIPLAGIIIFASRDDLEAKRVGAIFVLFIAAMMFWAVFEQAGLSIAVFADRLTDNSLGPLTIPSAWYQSLNPLFVILLAPLMAALWSTLGAGQPSTPAKFSLALVLLGASFLLMVPAAHLTASGRISPLWLVGLFFGQTVAELCLSPVGLAAMTRLAPVRFVALILGIWLLAAAFGNKLAGLLGAEFHSEDPDRLATFFLTLGGMAIATGLALVALTPWLRRLMGDVK